MKCTNFDNVLKKLAAIEKDELKKAVAAHGGLYRFEEDDRPIITFDTSDAFNQATDAVICQVSVNDQGYLVLTGIPVGERYEIELDPDDVAHGHLRYITEAIPETETLKEIRTQVDVIIRKETETVIQSIRENLAEKIRSILRRNGTDSVPAADLDCCSTPVVQENPYNPDLTMTLDQITMDDEGHLDFDASSCFENASFNQDTISTDALADIAGWLEENEESLHNNDGE